MLNRTTNKNKCYPQYSAIKNWKTFLQYQATHFSILPSGAPRVN
jgi:hypothetical protein